MKTGKSWAGADQQVVEEEGVGGAKRGFPGHEDTGLLSIRSFETAWQQTISAEFEYKN